MDTFGTLLRMIRNHDSGCMDLPASGTSGTGTMTRVRFRVDETFTFATINRFNLAEKVDDGVYLHRHDFVWDDDYVLSGTGPAQLCVAVFLEGSGTMAIKSGPPMEIGPGTTVVFYSPNPVSGEDRMSLDSRFRCLDMRFSLQAMERLRIPDPGDLLQRCTSDCSTGDALLVAGPTPAPLLALARDIFSCRYIGAARTFYLRGKVLEALAHVTADEAPAPANLTIGRRDRDRIEMARSLLRDRFEQRWTIPDLARAVGLNERKLKTGFHQIVGMTIHNFLEEQRLSAAASLLSEGSDSVTDIALAVGYRNLSHFAKRFRGRHGVSPRNWRNLE